MPCQFNPTLPMQQQLTLLRLRCTFSQMLPAHGSQVFSRRNTGSISGLHCDYSQYLRLCAAETVLQALRGSTLRVLPVLGGFVLLILPVIAVFGHSVLLILPVLDVFGPSVLLIPPALAVFRSPVLQYSQYSKYEMYSILKSILGV